MTILKPLILFMTLLVFNGVVASAQVAPTKGDRMKGDRMKGDQTQTEETTGGAIGDASAQTAPSTATTTANGDQPRDFQFSYGATLIDLPEGAEVQVWFPIAETNRHQTVALRNSATPGTLTVARDDEHQNQIGHFQFVHHPDKETRFKMVYDVTRRPATAYQDQDAASDGDSDSSNHAPRSTDYSRYLKANRTVPISGKPIDLIKGMALPKDSTQKARKLYDVVFDHMSYDKSKPGYGNGDSVWACDSRTGNCTDFHSLFISLSRNQSVPSKFEIGFPLPTDKTSGKIGGYHCWAWFLAPEQGWVPVDISEADKHPQRKDELFGYLPPDRMTFSSGRDIVLVPASQSGPLNFFVYPHVEVDGKTWPKSKIQLDFSFEDASAADKR